ncbi:MAG TPA: glutathione S-transferase family protein [Caulobacterales bacterium]|nr:glutathione S-transferase family protein [Caulobacterales bacterium]
MIILFGGGVGFGLPDVSPFVTKTEVQLQMAGLAYRKEPCRPADGPKGQMPFIDDDGARIGDSTFIRAHLEQKYGVDLDEGLSPIERAQAWAVERMLENQFYWAIVYSRWLLPENFAKGPSHFFDTLPDELRRQRLEAVRMVVRGVGLTRHSDDEIVSLADRTLLALSELLGQKTFLFGERPAGVDATAAAMIAHALTPFFDSPLRRRAETYANLVDYADRMMAFHFPQHEWLSSARLKHAEHVD